MHVTHLAIENFGPYRGRHEINLSAEVYGVVARHDNDAGRSNWLGKSWLLGAIRFALHGRLPPGCEDADGWITRGEDEGFVGLVLSDGTRIRRSRKRGSSTQLAVLRGKQKSSQKAAQEVIDTLIGLSRDDFEASMVVAQKATARMVTEDPAARTKLIDGWLGLSPLRDAESYAKDKLREAASTLDAAGQALTRLGDAPDLAALTEAATTLDEQATEAEQKLLRAREVDRERQAARDRASRRASVAQEYEEVVRRGKALAERVAAAGALPEAPTGEEVLALRTTSDRLTSKARDLAALTRGEFDGECPVTCKGCPVADQIREEGQQMQQEASQAAAAAREATAKAGEAVQRQDERARAEKRQDAAEAELEGLRDRARYLQDRLDEFGDEEDVPAEPEGLLALAGEAARLRERASAATRDVRIATDEDTRRKDAIQERDAAMQRESAWASAVLVIRTARRRLAAAYLGEIEASANALLANAGTGLSIRVRWEREGKDLADTCDGCGAAFAATRTERECRRCGAARGPNRIERLDVIPEPRSGAAEDLAGLSFQLAAAQWLRRRRGAPWSMVLVDEPFGALDGVLARATASALVWMLRLGSGFEQALVVTHGESLQDVMPAQVVIRSDGLSSRMEVV